MRLSWVFVFSCLVLSVQACSKTESEKSTALAGRVGSGVMPYEGAEPAQLFLGAKKGDVAEKCVRAVVVRDAELTCETNRCDLKAFYLPVRPVSNSQRALHVTDCDQDPELTKGHLLTDLGEDGSTAILYFQAARSGPGLWEQVTTEDGRYAIQLATEAAEGILALNTQGSYVWSELPD
ncbi:hypothetical protein [Limnobacter parvus]|uniref:Lipoprotein n=1 Tax=Limnobacter parvus TaxID=2939690 RepID=A0ABT1XFS6_9BURK|nr:hypothetical protein [Limnobacter parvus]MCR2746130.1 hypothetical protein [Limnobacter parvus]